MFNPDLIAHNIGTQRFHIIDEFLEEEHYHSLRNMANELKQQNLFRNAKIGQHLQAQQNDKIRSDQIFWIDADSPSPSIQAYLKKLVCLGNILNQTMYLGLVEFETHFAIYLPGTFYRKHVDQFESTKTRKISFVYYLNETWQTEFGGELLLYNIEDKLIQNISPVGNRLVCFDSELPHEVHPTHQTRFSITGWMKTRSTSVLIDNKLTQITQ
ncbi:2OG-Fe(II) oxygenase [Legionella pneumophila]|uniref:2OG-Fe(II) oxygenase n=1 Tax=Legionella pneumophila TaxID=446 RepID=UPI00048AF213|nr:2OG-Fe(II) oxygenase [Legionella pneumophila]HAT1868256.1 SM-20-like protein [Legionella pneumophila]HAT1908383.1 SM-20-like protein [Legionella pneumophila]HAT1917436.1 SM-20-like protein [Legionella pneumophila]HAT1923236.1 SM-20-like protein [Legionella pneumophila]HAT1985186.1 SM-20-like protein [Legionella pneumophila]